MTHVTTPSAKAIAARGWRIQLRSRQCRLYAVWHAMRKRCERSYDASYIRYGARGISVCAQWSNYSTFRIWAISSGFRKGLTLDRIDNDGNYEPGNCRWTDADTQSRNRRMVKVTPQVVREIRSSNESTAALRKKYGLRSNHIWMIRQRRIWRSV